MIFRKYDTEKNRITLEVDTIELAQINASIKFILENYPSDVKDLFEDLLMQFEKVNILLGKGNFAPKNINLEEM